MSDFAPPYRTIVVDPAWPYSDKLSSGVKGWVGFGQRSGGKIRGAANHYSLMSLEEIAAVPIASWAEPDSHLYLWTTNAFLEEAFAVMRAYGFTYKTTVTWVKESRDAVHIGMGRYFRGTTEHCLFGVRGRLPLLRNDLPTHFRAPRTRHSEKPDAFFDMVESASPGPYLSVFERRLRFGWVALGDEIGTVL